MNRDLRLLIARRERLVASIAAQRATLARDLAPWRGRLALVDSGLRGVRYLRSHPLLPVLASVALAYLRPKGSGKWMLRLMLAWKLGRQLLTGVNAPR